MTSKEFSPKEGSGSPVSDGPQVCRQLLGIYILYKDNWGIEVILNTTMSHYNGSCLVTVLTIALSAYTQAE